MNLKLVVASMSVLGLVSCPVLAATQTKHKHHHKVMKQEVHHDYKDMGALPAKDEPACMISQASVVLDGMNQNYGRSMPNPCNPGWFNRIQVSGGVNVDVGKFGNRNTNYMGENYQRLSLNDAYLNVSANVNEWAKAFASISYSNPTTVANNGYPTVYKLSGAAEYSAAYANNIAGTATNNVELEQGYVTLGNFDQSPFFLQVGKQFQDFSRYEIHPITRSLTQSLSETLATALKLGFITPMGFSGSLYGFDDPIVKVGNASKPTNYGASLGYDQPNDQLGYDVGVGYLYNMIGANDVAFNVVNNTGIPGGAYNSRVGAVALYGDVNSGPFSVSARWTTAVQRFNVNDLNKNGVAGLVGGNITGAALSTASGAKPWAAGITGAYGFDAWGRNQNVYLGYQASREAAGLNLPKSRWLVGYGIDVFGKNTNVGIEWDHDMAYSTGNGGTNNNSNLVSVRSSVKFG